MEIIDNTTSCSLPRVCRGCCLKVSNLGVTLGGHRILHDVNLHTHCGGLTAIIGPNGGGKSTLLRAMVGEIPFSGEVSFLDYNGNRARQPRVGYVPQRTPVDPSSPMTVRDLFMTALSVLPVWLMRDRRIEGEARHALGHMEADHLMDHRLGTLSGGELQRVLVSLALTPLPDVLLLDEPVSGIDNAGMSLFYRMLSGLRRKHDLSIVIVSHDLALAARFADSMALIKQTLLLSGEALSVVNNPKTREIMGFAATIVEPEDAAAASHHTTGSLTND